MRNFIFLLFIVGAFTAFSQNSNPQDNWSFPAANGDTVSIKSLRGKYVLLDFWYMNCPPCRQSIPSLVDIYEKHKDKLVVLGMNPIDKDQRLQNFIQEFKMTYPVVICNLELASRYNVAGYPTMILLDKEGKIKFVNEGFGTSTELHKSIEKLIKD